MRNLSMKKRDLSCLWFEVISWWLLYQCNKVTKVTKSIVRSMLIIAGDYWSASQMPLSTDIIQSDNVVTQEKVCYKVLLSDANSGWSMSPLWCALSVSKMALKIYMYIKDLIEKNHQITKFEFKNQTNHHQIFQSWNFQWSFFLLLLLEPI